MVSSLSTAPRAHGARMSQSTSKTDSGRDAIGVEFFDAAIDRVFVDVGNRQSSAHLWSSRARW